MKIAEIECAGRPREMGRQTGETLRDDIAANLELQPRPNADAWRHRLPLILETTKKYLPDVLEEMQGTAEGAGVPVEEIYRLNFPLWDNTLDTEGCTNIIFSSGPDGPVWGKNNDGVFPAPARRIYARLSKPQRGIPQLVFGFAGWVAMSDGMNAEGLAVGHSSVGSIFPQSDHHPYIRLWEYVARSQCATTEDFIHRMSEVPLHGKGFSIVCVDRNGNAASLEAACPQMHIRRPGHPRGIHCVNCYQLPDLREADRRSPEAKKDAFSRIQHLNAVLESDGDFDVEHMKRILCNHAGQPICRHGKEKGDHNTEYAMIGLPAQNKVMYCFGNPCENEFKTIEF